LNYYRSYLLEPRQQLQAIGSVERVETTKNTRQSSVRDSNQSATAFIPAGGQDR